MLLYAIGAYTVARSSYCGWQCYNLAKNNPGTAHKALRFGAFGTLAPIIYYAPFFATASMISTIGDKVFKDNKPQGPLEEVVADSFNEAVGGLFGLAVTDLLGKPWHQISKLAAKYLAESF